MDEYKKLVDELRVVASYNGDCHDCNQCVKAASAIEMLLEERDKSLEELHDLKIMWDMYGGDVGITDAFQKAKERDAAVEELRLDASCKTCTFGNGYHPECDNCVATRERKGIHHKNWQWRGLEESRHVKPTLSLRFHESDFRKEETDHD